MAKCFLLKSEPFKYSIDDLARDGQTAWDGVRNHTAKLVLLKAEVGDEAFIYHSNEDKAVVGVAKVVGAARPDPSDETGTFVCIDLAFERRTKRPVTLKEFKDAGWDQFDLVRMSRLSCMHVPDDVRAWILEAERAEGPAPVVTKPKAAKAGVKKPLAKKPAAKKPAAKKPAAKKAAPKKAAAKKA